MAPADERELLFRRLARLLIHPTPSELAHATDAGFEAAFDRFGAALAPDAPRLTQRVPPSDELDLLVAGVLGTMAESSAPLAERAAAFLHNILVSAHSKVRHGRWMLEQLDLFRSEGLGAYEQLLVRVAQDPAMVRYLDLESSTRLHPNENFARELFKLFTMGSGPYGEADIREAARAFTGHQIRGSEFHFSKAAHDAGEKTVLGQRGAFGAADIVRIAVQRPETHVFMAKKIARAFVADAPTPAMIQDIAAIFDAEGGVFHPVLRRVLAGPWIADPAARLTRDPLTLVLATWRALGHVGDLRHAARALPAMGQRFLDPPSVAGYEGGAAWLAPANLLARRAFVIEAVQALPADAPILAELHDRSPKDRVPFAAARILPGPPAPQLMDVLLSAAEDPRRLLAILLCHPDFHVI